MNLDINPEEVLNEPDLHVIEEKINTYVEDLALLGDIEFSRELASAQLTAPSLIVGVSTGSYLHFAWRKVGDLPDGISETSHEVALKAARKQYDEDWPEIAEEQRTFDEAGLEACLRIVASGSGSAYDRQALLVKALDISLRIWTHGSTTAEEIQLDEHRDKRRRMQMEASSGFSGKQLLLSDLDSRSAGIVNQVVSKWTFPNLKRFLSSAERLWPYFARGLLADAFNLTPEAVESKGRIIVDTYKKRLHNHPRPYTSKSSEELLQIANDNTIRNTRPDFWGRDEVIPESLLHSPATNSDISGLEERLDIILPQDFKSFLQITNGFGSGDQGIFTGVFPDPNIHSSSEIVWFEEEHGMPIEFLHLPKEIESLLGSEHDLCDTPLPLAERVLEIGSRDVDVIWLVTPEKIREAVRVYKKIYEVADEEQKRAVDRAVKVFAGSWEKLEELEWCCVSADLGSPGQTWYKSFREYLERSTWSSGKVFEI